MGSGAQQVLATAVSHWQKPKPYHERSKSSPRLRVWALHQVSSTLWQLPPHQALLCRHCAQPARCHTCCGKRQEQQGQSAFSHGFTWKINPPQITIHSLSPLCSPPPLLQSLFTISENACFHISAISIYSGISSIDFNGNTLKHGAKCIFACTSSKQ